MAEDIAKRLRMMRFWLIGVFLIVLAADISIAILFPRLLQEPFFWLGLIVAVALVALWYFVYKWWISRR